MAKRRGFSGIPCHEFNVAGLDFAQDILPSIKVHYLRQTIMNRLADERMVRRLEIARAMLETSGLHRKDGSQQILGPMTLQMRRHLFTAALAENRERPRHVPPPANSEHGCGQ